jgi:predicted dehydrogenase
MDVVAKAIDVPIECRRDPREAKVNRKVMELETQASNAAFRPLRVAVVGVGKFGRLHAKHYAQNKNAALVAVVDTNAEAADAVAGKFGCAALYDYRALIGKVDAVSVVVPTSSHFDISYALLDAGIDALVEKPLADTIASADALMRLADRRGRILQVGHIERFSSCFRALSERVRNPLYFECYRIAPWNERNLDTDVIFDLMIHDIDIIVGLAGSDIVDVSAVGTRLFSNKVDLANARLTFASGCVANITASRVSHKVERSMRVFQPGSYVVCDFVTRRILSFRMSGEVGKAGMDAVVAEVTEAPREDSLANEINAFLSCVRHKTRPTVDGRAGSEAVRIAETVNKSIHQHSANANALGLSQTLSS